jgi:hypothetical protein
MQSLVDLLDIEKLDISKDCDDMIIILTRTLKGTYDLMMEWKEDDYQGEGAVIYKSSGSKNPLFILITYDFGSCTYCDYWQELTDYYDPITSLQKKEVFSYIKKLISESIPFYSLKDLHDYPLNQQYMNPDLVNQIKEFQDFPQLL